MKLLSRVGSVLAILAGVSTSCFVFAEPATQPSTQPAEHAGMKATDFLRFVDRGSEGGRLETSDVAFRNADGVTVHLVAAVHIGEREYFDSLNESFKLRDAVLYEMVKGKDQPLPEPGVENQSHSSIGQFQRYMKDALNLEFQLDCIDYTKPNFIHADLDAETFEKMQSERGESITMLMLKQMFEQMSHPAPDVNADDTEKQMEDLVRVFTRPDSERRFKMMLAKQMVSMESDENAPGFGMLNGTVILTERNKAAMDTLETTLKTGKRDIAIFYGAAHMPDLSARLEKLGFEPIATQWHMAWNLTIRQEQPSAVENVLIEMIRAMKDLDQ